MKNLLFLLVFFIAFQVHAQDDPPLMWQTIELTPKSGHYQQLMDGLKAHNSKYHTEGSQSVDVWAINSGPRSGRLEWVMGPLSWSEYDTPLSDDHLADWLKNVDQHAEMGEWAYWEIEGDLTYAPDNFNPTVMIVRYFDIKPRKWDNATRIVESLFEVYREHNFDIGLHVFDNQMDSGDGKDWAILWMYESHASMDKDRDFWEKYEKMHGVDRSDYFEAWNEAADFKGSELQALIPGVSAAGN